MKQPEISWSIQGGAVVKELTVSTLKRRVVFSAPNMRGLLEQSARASFCRRRFRMTISGAAANRWKRAILGAVAAYYDADAVPSPATAVIAWGRGGAFPENRLYWSDYVENGRDAGRAHLFVGTLPTIPLCEAAIALNLNGPGYYLDCPPETLREEIAQVLSDPALDGHSASDVFLRKNECVLPCARHGFPGGWENAGGGG